MPPETGGVVQDCSWHPGVAVYEMTTDGRCDFRDIYRWTCCDERVLTNINKYGADEIPFDEAPCKRGAHEVDPDTRVVSDSLDEMAELRQRLAGIRAIETAPSNSSDVFISYSHKDSAFVARLGARFKRDGIGYFQDVKDMFAGDRVEAAIVRGIATHSVFAVVVSESSLRSPWVAWEVDRVIESSKTQDKAIIPLLIQDIHPDQLPTMLSPYIWIDFSTDFEPAYHRIAESIGVHMRRSGLKFRSA
jgi:hypothetical protein